MFRETEEPTHNIWTHPTQLWNHYHPVQYIVGNWPHGLWIITKHYQQPKTTVSDAIMLTGALWWVFCSHILWMLNWPISFHLYWCECDLTQYHVSVIVDNSRQTCSWPPVMSFIKSPTIRSHVNINNSNNFAISSLARVHNNLPDDRAQWYRSGYFQLWWYHWLLPLHTNP